METAVLVLCWLGVLQSLLLGVYFLSDTHRKKSNLFLGVALILIGIRAAKSTLYIFDNYATEFVFNIGFAAHAAIAPIILLYVRSLKKELNQSFVSLLHFIPAAAIILSSPLLTLNNFWYQGGYGVLLYYTLFYIGVYSIEFYQAYRSGNLKADTSTSWVLILLGTVSLFQLAYFGNYILGITPYTTAPVFYAIALYFITFVVLRNKADFNKTIKAKYQNLKMSDADMENFRQKILSVMAKDRPYLDTDFSLQKLSALTSIPQHLLSHTFSSVFNQSFTNFINMYRVEESKKILRDPEKDYLSIAGIAYECGFNSLSSFNVSFKKNLGITPSAFKKAGQKFADKSLRYI